MKRHSWIEGAPSKQRPAVKTCVRCGLQLVRELRADEKGIRRVYVWYLDRVEVGAGIRKVPVRCWKEE